MRKIVILLLGPCGDLFLEVARVAGVQGEWQVPYNDMHWYAAKNSNPLLEPQTTIKKWMFGETTISYVKIGNRPIATTIYGWLFGVPGSYYSPQI